MWYYLSMGIRKILKYPDPFLRKPTKAVTNFSELANRLDAVFGEDVHDAMDTLLVVDRGAALAANQIGIDKSFFVVNTERPTDLLTKAIFNPRILSKSSETAVEQEGCLSFPGIAVAVRRSVEISVAYQDFSGLEFKQDLKGWWARVFQHETDHLNGVLFVDELSNKQKIEIVNKIKMTK
jgi:peptide deformylase